MLILKTVRQGSFSRDTTNKFKKYYFLTFIPGTSILISGILKMLTTIIILTLAFSFCFQILVIILYLLNKNERYYRMFLGTFLSNTILMILISVVAIRNPDVISKLNIGLILWVISGFLNIILVSVQIAIVAKLIKRSKDPAYYDLNFFGKKVYRPDIIQKSELGAMFLSMPLFLLVGSYFTARLINLILFGSL